MAGLLETVQDLQLDKKTTLLQSLEQGTFTLRNMKEQFQTITSMGPLSKVMGMMPGIPQEMLAMGDKEGSQRIKLLMCVMDSMTAAELDSDAKCFVEQPGRLYRVARGSGANVR